MEEFKIENFKKDTSFYIEASAGTGKTYTIMQIVKKLIKEDVTLDKILIVTYTEKAVGELKDRVREELEKVIMKEGVEREKFQKALEIVANAPIFTIHSFCQQTLAQSSFYASVPSSLEMTSESNVVDMSEQKLRDEFTNDKEFQSFGDDEIANILEDNSGIRDILKSAVEKYYLKKNGEEAKDIISLVEFDKDTEFSPVKKYIFNKIKELYKKWLIDKENNSKQTFNDMIRSMHESISSGKKDNKLIEHLRDKYTYAIIDEFQDTNQKQWDIFKTIFLGDKNNSVPGHSLIVVGDPKQSIYSFQGADVSVYNKAKECFGKGYKLSTNYRSTNNIIESCNYLIGGSKRDKFFDLVDDENFTFTHSKPPEEKKQKLNAKYFVSNGFCEKPIWLIKNDADSNGFVSQWDFADVAAKAIKNCCARIQVDGKTQTRLMVFDKKSEKKLRDVDYSDFTILYKQRSEIEPIIAALKNEKIPFIKYKDTGLFSGKECADWIAILQAINADDFAEYNRKLLNKALFTKFFSVPLKNLENKIYDYPNNEKRILFYDWKKFAESNNWLHLIEKIFDETNVEQNLVEKQDYDSLTRYRQIGSYIAEFLCKGDVTLADCIGHLEALSDKDSGEETQGDDGNIVELGTDNKCVKLMTMHASKGLEFPVVISVGGFKGKKLNDIHCWQGHIGKNLFLDIRNKDDIEKSSNYKEAWEMYKRSDEYKKIDRPKIIEALKDEYNKNQIICDEKKINNKALNICKENFRKKLNFIYDKSTYEQDEEFKRLFYVAYTRASSLLILPYYNYGDNKPYYEFLKNRFAEMVHPKGDNKAWIDKYVWCRDYNEIKGDQIQGHEYPSDNDQEGLKETTTDNQENKDLKTVKDTATKLITFKQSYSSLSKGKADIRFVDSFDNENEGYDENALISINNKSIVLSGSVDTTNKQAEKREKLSLAGAYFGNALHEIFEKANFENFKITNNSKDKTKIKENENLINEILLHYGLIKEQGDDKSKENKQIVEDMIYSSLNAVLPKIRGSKGADNANEIIHLADIKQNDRLTETEFMFNGIKGKWYCDGFMDLVFRYKDGENYRYCILDYKSDKLEKFIDYSDSEKLKLKIDVEYSIQRVLYSYCLVKWLNAIYGVKDEEQTFEKYFGGIYYLLARGTVVEKQNGIYAHTWNSFKDLKNAYDNISHLKKAMEED